MQNHLQTEQTDLGSFLGKIANRLSKEGNSLQALAEMWFEDGEEKREIFRQTGIDVNNLGEQLLTLRNRLCQDCMMQEVKVILSFTCPTEEKEAD